MSIMSGELREIIEGKPDHAYTHENLPELIMSGAVRSWDVELPGAEATVGEIDSKTAASFPVDARGEKISLVLSEQSAEQLGLFVLTATGTELVQLNTDKPTIQTLPGQRILIPTTGENPTYYLCEYRNDTSRLDLEVSPAFESIRSLVWNVTHHHPRVSRRAARSSHMVEVDERPENDLRIQFSYESEENARELMFYEDTENEIGQSATLLGGVSITGQLRIEGLNIWSQRDWHRFLMLADGRVIYRNTTQCIALSDEKLVALKEWLYAQATKLWNATD